MIYILTVDTKEDDSFKTKTLFSITGPSLIAILAKLPLEIHQYLMEEHKKEIQSIIRNNDDIPF